MALSFIFYRVHVTRCHRVSIDRSSWIQLELPYSTAGRTYSIQIPQTTCQTTNFFLQFKFCQVVTGLFQWLLGLHSNKTPNLQCSAAFPPGSSEVCTSAYVLIFIHHCSELPISKVQELHAHPTEWHFAIAQYAVCCYYCLNVKTSHSHFHLNTTFSLLRRNTDCFWSASQKVPQSHLKIYSSPQFIQQNSSNRNENRKTENYFTSFPAKLCILLPPPLCCTSQELLWPHFEGNALT